MKTWTKELSRHFIFQGRSTNDQQVYEKMLNSLLIREMQIQTKELSPHNCSNGYY
jgi:hypothetical protein